jgi:hypothetical protein
MAATHGTTGFTCKKKKEKGGAGFSRAHCASADVVSEGAEYEHVAIAENTTTEVKGSNAKTSGETTTSTIVKFKSVVAGSEVELQATGWEGSGSMENRRDAETGEHYVQEEGSLTFTGVTVTKPAGKGCKVLTGAGGAEGTVDTNQLSVTSKGQGDALKFQPKEGTTFLNFTLSACSVGALNGTVTVTGSLTGNPDGAVVSFSHSKVTEQGTLKCGSQKAGLEGIVTISSRDPILEETEFTPLSVTTVETP